MHRLLHKMDVLASAFLRSRRGSVMQLFAFALLPVMAASGLAVDGTRLFLVRDSVQRAVDAAGLAAGHTLLVDDMETDARSFFDANFTNIENIATLIDFTMVTNADNSVIDVSATVSVDMTFMGLFGFDEVEFARTAQITRETRGMELALVMDNTGSMRSGGKMSAAITAAHNLIEAVFGSDDVNPNLWVSLVPYTATVNIGTQHTEWLSLQGQADVGIGGNYEPTSWLGCVQARSGGLDETDDTPDLAPFTPYLYPDDVDNDWILTDAGGNVTGFDLDERNSAQNNGRGPNLGCGPPITPLVASKTVLNTAIDAMQPWHRGGTTGNLGLVWGWRALSPSWRGFWEGTASATLPLDYDEPFMDKVVVIMTDGQNQFFDFTDHEPDDGEGPDGSDYTAYGRLGEFGFATLDDGRAEIDERFARTCEAMKAEGIIIYAITFGSTPNSSTQDLFRNCATKSSFFFHAPSNAELEDVFTTIGRQLSNLRISQ